ncbi:MAG: hypothetical protein JO348_07555 [Alphaproteobacteria bacterium]|nr:hypothetical protein [Alphaproteobacteria bacterium]MBV9419612.1 hypothetical protein [Alphaproteobacteria bacterium]
MNFKPLSPARFALAGILVVFGIGLGAFVRVAFPGEDVLVRQIMHDGWLLSMGLIVGYFLRDWDARRKLRRPPGRAG